MAKRKESVLGEGLRGLLGRTEGAEPSAADPLAGAEPVSAPEGAGTDPLWDAAVTEPPVPPAAVATPPAHAERAPRSTDAAPAALEVDAPPEGGTLVVEDMELLQSFIQESQDHLQTIEEKIITLETVRDLDVINEIFRCMHTMKGNSSFLGLTAMKELSHRLESLLDGLRNDTIELSAELVDVLLAGADSLLAMVRSLDASCQALAGKVAPGASAEIELPRTGVTEVLARVNRLLSAGPPSAPAPSPAAPSATFDLVTAELVQKYNAESMDLLDEAEKSLLELERNPEQPDLIDEIFRLIHTIKGNSGFMGFAAVETACMKTETLLETLRNGSRKATGSYVSTLLEAVDSTRRAVIAAVPAPSEPPPRDRAAGPSAGAPDAARPVGEILVEMGEASREDLEHALDIQERRVGEILVAEGKVSQVALRRALDSQKKQVPTGETAATVERKDLRVDMVKLDKLFDLMGELITAEAMVIHNPEVSAMQIEAFSKSAAYLSKITREMQEITMTIRMIPLEGLFNKMRRLVRDLARKFGKNINFQVSGQETEMDRNVIEEISDPLVHIIRNAIDHGVETEDKRLARGKSPAGTVSLGARYEGNEIWITIRDDGAGLNREKILAKAVEKGMLKGDPAALADEEVWQYIFAPGFSTADKVSEISGRGVGMDVVKRNMDKLRGKVDVSSVAGQGTQQILKIPLTLAIMDGITVRVGKVLYALPLGDILEFHKAVPQQITRTGNKREVIRMRNEIIPVIKLCEFYGTAGAKTSTTDGIVLMAQRSGSKAALLADQIVGYQQIVVKALPQYMTGMRAISGCSILGNGEVSLIIDTGALIKAELQ
jgi:two-component system, chemotaxis family, sensor kinase CheA